MSPMDRSKYPPNWGEIAAEVKRRAGWKCERCGAPHQYRCKPNDRALGGLARTLTVHHKDHNPANNRPDNLVALCAACHLREEGRWRRSAKGRQGELFRRA